MQPRKKLAVQCVTSSVKFKHVMRNHDFHSSPNQKSFRKRYITTRSSASTPSGWHLPSLAGSLSLILGNECFQNLRPKTKELPQKLAFSICPFSLHNLISATNERPGRCATMSNVRQQYRLAQEWENEVQRERKPASTGVRTRSGTGTCLTLRIGLSPTHPTRILTSLTPPPPPCILAPLHSIRYTC